MSHTDVLGEGTGGTEGRGWIDVRGDYVCERCGNERDFYYLKDGFSQEVHFRQQRGGFPDILDTVYRPTHLSVTYVICQSCFLLADTIREHPLRVGLTAEM